MERKGIVPHRREMERNGNVAQGSEMEWIRDEWSRGERSREGMEAKRMVLKS
jgi:hypothetical protein